MSKEWNRLEKGMYMYTYVRVFVCMCLYTIESNNLIRNILLQYVNLSCVLHIYVHMYISRQAVVSRKAKRK